MAIAEGVRPRNRLLRAMSERDLAVLKPGLERVSLDMRMNLQLPGRVIERVYFPESAIASVVAVGGDDSRIEIGLVGYEGVSSLAVVLGDRRSPHEIFIQLPGSGFELPANTLTSAMEESPSLRTLMLSYAHAFTIQVSWTALANARLKLEGRLARWLLMSQDRAEGDELPLTHEFISVMLGVRRPGVTVALQILEGRGLIRAVRSRIHILDREGLEESAKGFYGIPEAEYRRLIG
ncbi:Crp/Fnr family transcriptional regulator [Mesorhizobium sp. BR1-1-16]|uniref:Crp/Fnr family transcriptional regulator n=1 Tax=Mesorhizobium sp. BR1-1-16 TaxID=2876653 RepID=UPI001CCB09EE|nr:Crp/Fnr family transcriptional regulator [Mesorhizobium sp. BR1-1-16]